MSESAEYVFPLSFAQQRLWLLDRMAPGNPFYNIPLAIPIQAQLNIPVLERALNAIIQRQESLRTVFDEIDGEPAQIVRETMPLGIEEIDISHLSAPEQETRTAELAGADAVNVFNLRTGPLIRCSVVTRGPADSVLLLSMHHIVSDGWSMGILARELTALYQAFSLGQADPLPELEIQYADYSVWQRETFQGTELEGELDYWRDKLSGLPQLDLPTDKPRPDTASFKGAAHLVDLGPKLSAAVRAAGRPSGATPFMVLLAAFAVVMARRSGQDDLAIGAPIAGRTQPEIEELIGFFVNSLVFRIDATGDPSFATLLERVRDTCLDAYQHQELPFERLVEEINPSRDPSRNPLFQITFQLVNAPTLGQSGEGAAGPQVHRGSAIFDMAFTLLDSADTYRGMIEYSTDLFEAETIARIADEFMVLLEAAADSPDTPISWLPLCAEADWDIIDIHELGPQTDMPDSPSHVLDEIAARVQQNPEAVALELGDTTITYAEMRARWENLARHLQAAGVGPEGRVGLLLDRSPELVIGQLATMAAGAAFVSLDTSYPSDHLKRIAEDSQLDVMLTQRAHVDFARSVLRDGTQIVVLDEPLEVLDGPPPPGPLHSECAAYVIYTSGSTGVPKGVTVPHSALSNHMRWMVAEFGFDHNTRVLQRTAACFDASIWEVFAPLMSGGTLVLLPPEAQRDPELIVRCISDHNVTVVQTVPSLLRLMLKEPGFYACTCLKQFFSGGEPLPEDLRAQVAASLELDIVNLYGPTETTIQVATAQTDGTPEPFGVPIGHPIENTALYVLDDDLAPVPVGVAGEVWVSGANLARGYHDRPVDTAAAFIPDPFSDISGSRMYRTRDLALRRADGALIYQGRNDTQIKLRGFRMELGDIEARIRDTAGVSDCAVFTAGSDASSLIAAIVPADGAQGDDTDPLTTQHVDQWESIYEGIYGQDDEVADLSFNTVGWTSSYSGQNISEAEMAIWRDTTVARIRALKPKRLLEIGCGTGLLLTQLAPEVEHYVATDFSAPVVEELRQNLDALGLAENGEVLQRRADELEGFEPQSFDTVVLNSVVQYFPSADYLADVIRKAARLVRPGGAIFVGDVRSLDLLGAFHLSIAKSALPDSATGAELLHLIHREAALEKELVLDSAFFHALANDVPEINGIQSACKRGGYDNELGKFRYDVTLQVGSADTHVEPTRLDWLTDALDAGRLESHLQGTDADCIEIINIPNARVAAEVRLNGLIRNGSAQKPLHEALATAMEAKHAAMDPEDFCQMAERLGLQARVRYAPDQPDRIEALFWRVGVTPPDDSSPANLATGDAAYRNHANDPLATVRFRDLSGRVAAHLNDVLPAHMVPAFFSQRDALPLTANGKLDRRALALSEQDRNMSQQGYVAPRNPLEEALSILWAEVLDTGHIGIDDDFFTELGGHSLIAVQLINKLRETLETDVALRTLFERPTVRSFAEGLAEAADDDLEATAELFVRISQMSEAEIDAALGVDAGTVA
ncbi:amino acid adenylation domain-containing protein [uncultured Tateyamaria sp.]|uniref:amino acid adenylation domain-containing protein n=1 Tax=uncultured Tateyamaria sp. TaxID=455651 RepID=UPI002637147C|nr:amino acid adenylation domain-containing protein [uncultured Tateyamaria sp.]